MRHVSRMFVVAAHLRVPFFAVVLRKGYGLGAMAMAGGGFHAPVFTVAWPSGEFGAMGLEGAVRLGYRKELEAAPKAPQRDALYQTLVAEQYAKGKAINMAATLEIDAVIDPAQTRALAGARAGFGTSRRDATPHWDRPVVGGLGYRRSAGRGLEAWLQPSVCSFGWAAS